MSTSQPVEAGGSLPPTASPPVGPPPAIAPHPYVQRSLWQNAWHYLLSDRFAVGGAVLVVALTVIAIAAPLLAPFDPLKQLPDGLSGQYAQPLSSTAKFLLGTDSKGRDELSRLIWGGRISITVAFCAVGLSLALSVVVGGVAGYYGGWADTAIMRFIDLMLSFPALLFQIAISTVMPPSLFTIIFILTIFGWIYPARVFRGQVLTLRERPFVEAARSVGVPGHRIFFRHIVPQLIPTIIVFATLRVPSAIMAEAGLSFLGLGVRPPTPSWGNLIQDGFQYYRTAPWLMLYPGLAIMLTVLGFNLLGDGLRDALDPNQWAARLTPSK